MLAILMKPLDDHGDHGEGLQLPVVLPLHDTVDVGVVSPYRRCCHSFLHPQVFEMGNNCFLTGVSLLKIVHIVGKHKLLPGLVLALVLDLIEDLLVRENLLLILCR
jgi:hypothetical protein